MTILSLCTQRCYGRYTVSRKSVNHYSGLSILMHAVNYSQTQHYMMHLIYLLFFVSCCFVLLQARAKITEHIICTGCSYMFHLYLLRQKKICAMKPKHKNPDGYTINMPLVVNIHKTTSVIYSSWFKHIDFSNRYIQIQ